MVYKLIQLVTPATLTRGDAGVGEVGLGGGCGKWGGKRGWLRHLHGLPATTRPPKLGGIPVYLC